MFTFACKLIVGNLSTCFTKKIVLLEIAFQFPWR